MVLRAEHKNELLRNFNALKELCECEFEEEENLLNLLSQLSETMYNYNLEIDYSPDYDHYLNNNIRNSLKNERNKALSSLVFHNGSLL